VQLKSTKTDQCHMYGICCIVLVCLCFRNPWLWLPAEHRHWHLENIHHPTGCQVSGLLQNFLSCLAFQCLIFLFIIYI